MRSPCTNRSEKSDAAPDLAARSRTMDEISERLATPLVAPRDLGRWVQVARNDMFGAYLERGRLHGVKELGGDSPAIDRDIWDRWESDAVRECGPGPHEPLDPFSLYFRGRRTVREQESVALDDHFIELGKFRRLGIPGGVEQMGGHRRNVPRTPTAVHEDEAAAGVEPTARGRVDWTRNLPREDNALPAAVRVGDWNRGQQSLRVRG